MGVSEIRRLGQLEEENARLKRLAADLGLDKTMLQYARATAENANGVWSMDFVSDWLFDDRPFRILTVLDCHTREALATCARMSFRAYQVAEELDRLVALRGNPTSIRVDNGPEFAGRKLDQCAYLNRVELDFSRPEKPRDNAFMKPSTPACAANASTPPGSCP